MTPAERRVIEAARELKAAIQAAAVTWNDHQSTSDAWAAALAKRAALMAAADALDAPQEAAPQEAAPQDVVWVVAACGEPDRVHRRRTAAVGYAISCNERFPAVGPFTVARYVREDEPQEGE